ncbi:Baculoviral IAP repeat-containing protein 7-B [Bulinus truncatus]|nr:Baculoviral IAP repeat-containing protein 7-B [Bulinus truncatus]
MSDITSEKDKNIKSSVPFVNNDKSNGIGLDAVTCISNPTLDLKEFPENNSPLHSSDTNAPLEKISDSCLKVNPCLEKKQANITTLLPCARETASSKKSESLTMSLEEKQNQELNIVTPPDIETDSDANMPVRAPAYKELGIVVERPKRQEFALRDARLKTFLTWKSLFNNINDMADAGFYYTGNEDAIRCFFCGGTLKNWEEEDDAFIEHARYFPKCSYICQVKGQIFVDAIQELSGPCEKITSDMVEEKMKSLAESRNKHGRKNQELPAELKTFNVLLPVCEENSSKNSEVSTEKKEVTDRTLCKICLEKEISMVFLPCGHFVCCYDCSLQLKNCPVCRNVIKGVMTLACYFRRSGFRFAYLEKQKIESIELGYGYMNFCFYDWVFSSKDQRSLNNLVNSPTSLRPHQG